MVNYLCLKTETYLDNPTPSDWFCNFIQNEKELQAEMGNIKKFVDSVDYLAFDIETARRNGAKIKKREMIKWDSDILSCVSFSDGKTTYVVKTSHIALAETRPLFELLMTKPLIGHNIKFDLRFVKRDYGVTPPLCYDTYIAARVADLRRDKFYGLADVLKEYLKVYISKEEQISNWASQFMTASQIAYSAKDTFYLPHLLEKLNAAMHKDPNVQSRNKKSRYNEVFSATNKVFHLEMEVLQVFLEMEHFGVYIDKPAIYNLLNSSQRMENQLVMKFVESMGKLVNPRSSAQVLTAVKSKYSQSGYTNDKGIFVPVHSIESTNKDDLKPFRGQGIAGIDDLYEYRSFMNNLQRLEELAICSNEDNRLHTSFKTWGAISGRTSNPKPNLQNIKNKEKYGINLRKLFVAPPGKKLIVADYSQIQLVIIAAMTRDPVMMDVILNGPTTGLDLHRLTVANILKIDPFAVTKEQRKQGKAINFGYCNALGTRVLTISGEKKIEHIEVGDIVLTHKGNWKKVTATFSREVDELVHIETRTGKKVSSSTDHLWRIINPSANGRPSIQSWLEAEDLTEGKYMVANTFEHIHNLVGYFPEPIYARLLGWLLSDGLCSVTKEGITLKVLQDTKSNPKEYSKMKSVLLDLGFCESEEGFSCSDSKILLDLYADCELVFNRGKLKSRNFTQIRSLLSREEKIELLSGLWDGDGSVVVQNSTKSSICYYSASITLIEDIGYLLTTLGLINKQYSYLRKDKKTPINIVRICGSSSTLKFKDILRTEKCRKLDIYKPKKLFSAEEQISSIVKEKGKFPVFDLTVEDDHSFIANGLVSHNCFGMGPDSFCDYAYKQYDLIISHAESVMARDVYFNLYANLKTWHNEVKQSAFNGKYPCETMYGRKVYVTNFTEATNTPVQGTEADIMKLAMVMLDIRLKKEKLSSKAHMVNMIHDELVVEVDDDCAEYVRGVVQEEMEKAGHIILKGVLPTRVEAAVCDDWSEKA